MADRMTFARVEEDVRRWAFFQLIGQPSDLVWELRGGTLQVTLTALQAETFFGEGWADICRHILQATDDLADESPIWERAFGDLCYMILLLDEDRVDSASHLFEMLHILSIHGGPPPMRVPTPGSNRPED